MAVNDGKILFKSLSNTACAHINLRNGEGAKYAEEAYNLVSNQHGPEHPDVQNAATCLIKCCLEMKNYVDAERFARINYECLNDLNSNTDRKGWIFAIAKLQLASIWIHSPAQPAQGSAVAEGKAPGTRRREIVRHHPGARG